MEVYEKIIEIVDANLIFCLIPMILTLQGIELMFKNLFETKKALNLICWIIILYAFITGIITLIEVALNPEESAFVNRAVGPYAFLYWGMLLSALILPFTLLYKKLALKFWYVLIVAFCLKIGVYFERFIIIVTRYHRDYWIDNGSSESAKPIIVLYGPSLLQGAIITILILVVLEMTKQKTNDKTA